MLRKILMISLIFLMVGCARQSEEGEGEYPPLIYVNDNLYKEQNAIKEYSSDWRCLGEIENEISRTEPIPEENLTANSWPVGTKVYMDENEKIWIRVTQGQNAGKYVGYEVLVE